MLKLEFENLNTNKFHDELILANINPTVKSKDNKTWLLFPDIKEHTDEGENTTYTKKRIEQETIMIDDIEMVGDVAYWDSFDGESLIQQIQTVIDNHDPTPTPEIDYQAEFEQGILQATTLDELKAAIVGDGRNSKAKANKK